VPIEHSTSPSRRTLLKLLGALALNSYASSTTLQASINPDWTTVIPPCRIAANLYYVGSRDLASFVNSNLATSPPQIRASIEKLGFHYHDIRILLINHAHFDHCAGSARIQRETGAKYMVMDADVPDIESGGRTNFAFGHQKAMLYPAAKVARVLHDRDTIELGGTTLVARKTAGHTRGCTTFTLIAHENGKSYNTVIVGSPNVLSSYNLIDDPKYPQMAADFEQQFHTLKSLPCDIFLGAHGSYYNMLAKSARLRAGETNAFVDPAGYQSYVANAEQSFRTALRKQQMIRHQAHPV
jgi:metallo-beta-lactamase class B